MTLRQAVRVIYLIDTNVVLRALDTKSPEHHLARQSTHRLLQAGHQRRCVPQNFIELWNVLTRPVQYNGLGKSTTQAERVLAMAERLFPLLGDSPNTYAIWRRLIVDHQVCGKQSHDARIAAAMLTLGVSHILTFNFSDFKRYSPEGIVAVDPRAV